MSVQVSYKKQFLFGLIVLLCICIALESGSRIYEFFIQPCDLEKAETLSKYDYFSKRHICFDQQNIVYSYQPFTTIAPNQQLKTININSDGFRGSEINLTTQENYRIFVIGGSAVFGSGMYTDDETFPSELDNKFKQKYDYIDVINAGIPNITSFDELYNINEKIIQLDPNMIVVYDGANDVHYKRINETVISGTGDDISSIKDFQKYLRTPVVLYRHVLEPMMTAEKPTYHYDSESADLVASLWHKRMTEICTISNEKNIEVVVILQPTIYHGIKPFTDFENSKLNEWDSEKNTAYKKTFEHLIQKSKELNNCSLVLDFSDVFDNTHEGVYFDSVHLNNLGNKIIADKIYEKILPLISLR